MKYKILVTGGAGFIGSHLVDALIERGHEVRVLDSLDPQVHGTERKIPEYLSKKAEFIFGDISNEDVILRAIEDIEVIFHKAAAVGVGQSMYEIGRYVKTNTYGTAKLLNILVNRENSVKKLIVASSMSQYGEGKYECPNCGPVYPSSRPEEQMKKHIWDHMCPSCGSFLKPLPTDEEKPLKPESIYAITKRDQEEMCMVVGKAYGIPTVALRYFNVYGPRQALSNPYTGCAAIFCSRIMNDKPPLIFEDGNQTRDFIHISDIVKANLLALEKNSSNYKIYNVGTGRAASIKYLAEVLIKIFDIKLKPKITETYRVGDIRHCYADIKKIKQDLGFAPAIQIEEGLKDLVKWVKRQPAIEDRTEKALRELEERKLISK